MRWKQKHPDRVREAARIAANRHYHKHRERILADLRAKTGAKPRRSHEEAVAHKKEYMKKYGEAYRLAHREKILAYLDAYRKKRYLKSGKVERLPPLIQQLENELAAEELERNGKTRAFIPLPKGVPPERYFKKWEELGWIPARRRMRA